MTCSKQLAVDGGAPVRTAPWPAWPRHERDEIDAACAVLESGKVNYWTGQEGRSFEREFAASCDCEYAVALANGSLALELALLAYDIGPGDEVIVTPRSFMASASCVVMRGARPIFADIDPVSQNITASTVRAVLSPRTKAIIAVHLAGWPCDMDPLLELARKHSLVVIEDCAQAQGATYKNRKIGSLGHVAAFSFCQDKIMTTAGEGGFLTTNDKSVWEKAWSYKDHGKSFDAVYNRTYPPGFRWLHASFGTNWRLTEFQSAMGRVLLKKLPRYIDARRKNAQILSQCFSEIKGLRTTLPSVEIGHSYYKYYAFVEPAKLKAGWTRDRILQAVMAEGVPCFTGSCSEIYLEEAFASGDLRPRERLPVAKELGETALMFLVHPTISKEDQADVCAAVQKVFAVCC